MEFLGHSFMVIVIYCTSVTPLKAALIFSIYPGVSGASFVLAIDNQLFYCYKLGFVNLMDMVTDTS